MISTFTNVIQLVDKVLTKYEDTGELNLQGPQAKLLSVGGSITKLRSKFIIEPTIVISRTLKELESTDSLIELNSDLFMSYYTQAFTVLTEIHNIDASVSFDLLSSNKVLTGGVTDNLSDRMVGQEDFSVLPIDKDTNLYAVESAKSERYNLDPLTEEYHSQVVRSVNITLIVNKDNVSDKPYKIEIPVTMKASIVYSDFEQIENVVRDQGVDAEFGMRWMAMRSGEISKRDFLFAGDLIDKYKSAKLRDKDELMQIISDRNATATAKLVTAQGIGLNKYYGML